MPPGAAPSWTCTSSDIAVATTLVTGSGCAATGVAGGSATITAEITKGSDTREVTADLEVRPPPLAVSISPPSAVVEVGATAEFTLRVSGGAPGAAPSWTCASSDIAVATASDTASGCAATGVAAGSAIDHGGGHQGKRYAKGDGRPRGRGTDASRSEEPVHLLGRRRGRRPHLRGSAREGRGTATSRLQG